MSQVGGLDSKYLDEILKMTADIKIKIIAMGQATHGQNTINKYCTDMFKMLVKDHGVTVFILEAQYSCCRLIDNYIKGSNSFSFDFLINKLSWPWRSIHFVQLIKWMRKYNSEHNNILDFYGIDIVSTCNEYTTKDDTAIFVEKVHMKLGEMLNTKTLKSYDIDNFRDKSMFNVFMNIYNNRKKYFIFMSNSRVSREPYFKNTINFGDHMANYFKHDYFIIGNSFNGNSFLGANPKSKTLDVSNFKGEVDISKLKYYYGTTDDYDDEINFKRVTKNDLKYKLQNGITWSPKYNELLKKNNIPTKNNNTNYNEMFIIEIGSYTDPDNIYKSLTLYKLGSKFDVVIQLKGDSYLKF